MWANTGVAVLVLAVMKLMPQLCDLALFEPMGDAALKQVCCARCVVRLELFLHALLLLQHMRWHT